MRFLLIAIFAVLCLSAPLSAEKRHGKRLPRPPVARPQKFRGEPRKPMVATLTKRPARKVTQTTLRLVAPNGTKVVPLMGSLDLTASFYLPVWLGTPGQLVNLLIDTGSTDLVVYGRQCQGCPATAMRYSVSASKTGSDQTCDQMDYQCTNQCQYTMTCEFQDDYGGGGSISGNVVQDTVGFGGWNQSYIYFGQITDDSVPGDFVIPPEDGIMGFAFEGLSAWQQPSAFSYFENVYQSFSLCLSVNPPPVIEMGTNYRSTQKSSFNWTTIYDNPGWFGVYVEDAGMGGKSLGLSKSDYNDAAGYGVIVDSGTTFIIVTSQIFKVYTERLEAMCAAGVNLVGVCGQNSTSSILAGNCFNMTAADVALYPSISWTLYNPDNKDQPFTLTAGPEAILQEVCGGPGNGYAFGIQPMDSTPIILGDVLLQNYHVVFDTNSMYMGFGPLSGCPAPSKK